MGSNNTFGETNFNHNIMRHKRIMICGSSGTGKTTLAKHISESYGLPYINTSAKKVWREFGFISHVHAHTQSILNVNVGMRYQLAILEQRFKALEGQSNYVTDRSFVDNITYVLMGLSHSITSCEIEDFLIRCITGMAKCDLLLFVRWTSDIILEDDSNRIINRYYQAMVDKVMEWIIFSDFTPVRCPIFEIKTWDFELKKEAVKKCLEL